MEDIIVEGDDISVEVRETLMKGRQVTLEVLTKVTKDLNPSMKVVEGLHRVLVVPTMVHHMVVRPQDVK